MPLEKINCEECGRAHNVCPECGEGTVTVDSKTRKWGGLSPEFANFGMYAEIGEELQYKRVCWKCPWEEDIIMRIEEDE